MAVRHLNKASGGNALYRGGGSIGIVGAARSALLVAKDPQDDARRVVAAQKSNLSKPAPSLAFCLENATNGAVRVAWRGESPLGASELLAAPMDGGGRTAEVEAQGFLRELLDTGPVPTEEVFGEAKTARISEKTLRRAKDAMGVVSVRKGEPGKRGGGRWFWALPEVKVANADGWPPKPSGTLGDGGNPAYPSQKTALELEGQHLDGQAHNGHLNRSPDPDASLFVDPQETGSYG